MSAPVTAGNPVTVRTFRPGDEETIVGLLNAAYPGGWGTIERWRAKHTERQGFDPEDIYLAEMDGRIVGCLHTAIIPVRITDRVTLPLSLDGDLAVHPDARGFSIPEILYDQSRVRLHERGIPLRGGYTQTALWTRFYRPRIGYVSDFDTTVNYKKVLDVTPVRDRFLGLFGGSAVTKDPGRGPVLEVAIAGLPSFCIRLGGQVVAPVATDTTVRPSIRLVADQRLFGAFGADGAGMRGLVSLWKEGGLKVEAGPAGAVRAALWYASSGRRLMRERARAAGAPKNG